MRSREALSIVWKAAEHYAERDWDHRYVVLDYVLTGGLGGPPGVSKDLKEGWQKMLAKRVSQSGDILSNLCHCPKIF